MKIITKEDTGSQRIRSAQAGVEGKHSVVHSSLLSSSCSAQEQMDLYHSKMKHPNTTESHRKAHNSINIHKKSFSCILMWKCGSCKMEVPRLGQPWDWWLHRAQHRDACGVSGISLGTLSLVQAGQHTLSCGMYMTLATIIIRLHFWSSPGVSLSCHSHKKCGCPAL